MLILLSPAKRLSIHQGGIPEISYTTPEFIAEANILAKLMKGYSPSQLQKRLGIQTQLALQAAAWYAAWQKDPEDHLTFPALLIFNGDAFRGISAANLSEQGWEFAEKHLRIFSAMYGILRPTDRIQPYRLDLNNKIKPEGYPNLTAYWREIVTSYVQDLLKENGSDTIINLASEEYFKALDQERIKARIIQPVFKEFRDGTYKSLFAYVKFARGRMTRFILENRPENPEDLKTFDWEGYGYDENLSDKNLWVFTR